MKTKILLIAFAIIPTMLLGQLPSDNSTVIVQGLTSENAIYQLYPTENFWTFLKLDTRNGKIWQVHFTVTEDGATGEFILNALPLVSKSKEENGRFTLYPTKNMFNFLLLDQIDGNIYQVQWSMEIENRFIFPIEY